MAGRVLSQAIEYVREHPGATVHEIAAATPCCVTTARAARIAVAERSGLAPRTAQPRPPVGDQLDALLLLEGDAVMRVAEAARRVGCSRWNVYAVLGRARAGKVAGWTARRGARRGEWIVERVAK